MWFYVAEDMAVGLKSERFGPEADGLLLNSIPERVAVSGKPLAILSRLTQRYGWFNCPANILVLPESSRVNADDRLSRAPLRRIEGGDRIVQT
ncbi:hypothetical protein J2Z50_000755 [Ensifer mexicanus]|nr:hypothetical protein [Sinorhizobium mexicanum]